MAELATFQLKLSGDLSDRHQFEAYDGFTALAGAAWTLSLITNYVETGEIRHRGNFEGRHAVLANPMARGSLIADFSVLLQSQPSAIFGAIAASAGAGTLLYGLVHRVVSRNIGITPPPLNPETEALLNTKGGDIEALVGITEPSLRQAHDVIGSGAEEIAWIGGFSVMANFNAASKSYMKTNVKDARIVDREFTVTSFDGKSGNGSVFDNDLGHNVPIGMTKDTLDRYGSFFSWGLHQFINKTGKKIRMSFTQILAVDGRPKRYVVLSAAQN